MPLRIRRDLLIGCFLLLPGGALADEFPQPLTTASTANRPLAQVSEARSLECEPLPARPIPPDLLIMQDVGRAERPQRQRCGGGSGPAAAGSSGIVAPQAGVTPASAPFSGPSAFAAEVEVAVSQLFAERSAGSSRSSASCFLPGTLIKTPNGERPIESLRIGDRVVTRDGERCIKLIPRQVLTRRAGEPWPEGVAPVVFEPGALGPGLPHRRLFVSPLHAFYLEGELVRAKDLVNGTTVRQVQPPSGRLDYRNIELEEHGLLFANGVCVESYRPSRAGSRERLDNYAHFASLYLGDLDQPVAAIAPYRSGRFSLRALSAPLARLWSSPVG